MKTIQNKVTFAANVQDVTLVLDTKKSKLLEVEYVKSIVGLDGSVKHIFKHNGKDITIKQDGNGFRMYTNKEMFEHDNDVDMTVISIEGAARPHHSFLPVEDEDKVGISSVTFINGVPVEVDAPILEFECIAHRGYVKITPVYDPNVNIEEYYRSVEDATAFHDYVVIDKEGNEQTIKGRFSFILPNEEQELIITQLRVLLKAAADAGLSLIVNNDNGLLHAINSKTARFDDTNNGIAFDLCDAGFLPECIKLPGVVMDYCPDGYTYLTKMEEEK